MKKKLTLSVEESIVADLKELSSRRGVSVSRMVELWAQDTLSKGISSSVSKQLQGKWRGLEGRDDPRLDYLLAKH